ncbi:N-acetyltransferase [Kribbella capetownensis]|uniref:N-acetyltransferase n=1 Tax=Kribbella capetownensis TaxID=1572659 RepID=A0A4R0K127_9ACTN|nr:GNAT family N-acetyltransferase [Kribbella capetownensis]TCC51426.1 N-acetyltransferase [Kribbella capetownensis]
MDVTISAAVEADERASSTARLLSQLPAWFGMAEANDAYVKSAREFPALIARAGDETVGILLHHRHFPEAAEIHLMAISPAWHRRGIGTAMIGKLVSDLRLDACQILQVKTLGPSHPDLNYARTRAFYRSAGFLPLEETSALWPGNPCLLMVKPLG